MLALVNCLSLASAIPHGRKLSYTSLMNYAPGSQVSDHARIDLDQMAMQNELASLDYVTAEKIYSSGVYSKPAAVCTFSGTDLTTLKALADGSKSDTVYFKTAKTGTPHYAAGKMTGTMKFSTFTATSELIFTYPVADSQITVTSDVPSDGSENCWVGDLPLADQTTDGCVDGSTTSTTSTLVIGTGAGAQSTGCASGATAGFSTCSSVSAQITATCTNTGKRSLKGFSTAAKSKMYDPTLSSKDCPPQTTSPYLKGCPYTSYKPYFDYYCAASSSDCFTDGDYANAIVNAALTSTKTTLGTGNTIDFSASGVNFGASDTGKDDAKGEMIKKGTAYMNAWMYAIREFEDAIDDCTSNDLTANGGSSGPVHAWDEGVAFYVGSAMEMPLSGTALDGISGKGYLAYTLGNKRCANFKTCGENGDATKGISKQNIQLTSLFSQGQRSLLVGECDKTVPIKNEIVKKMTIPLIQGTLRYAYKQATTTPSKPMKEKGEGAIFAAAVLPQVHACNPEHAKTIYDNMNINYAGTIDHTAVKAAFEACYADMGVTCADIGGLWNGNAYYSDTGSAATPSVPGTTYDASPCVDPTTTNSSELSTGAIAGIAVGAGVALIFLLCLCFVINKERNGTPLFTPLTAGSKPSA